MKLASERVVTQEEVMRSQTAEEIRRKERNVLDRALRICGKVRKSLSLRNLILYGVPLVVLAVCVMSYVGSVQVRVAGYESQAVVLNNILIEKNEKIENLLVADKSSKDIVSSLQVENTALRSECLSYENQIAMMSYVNSGLSFELENEVNALAEEKLEMRERAVSHTSEEQLMMEYIVQCEANGCSKDQKIMVACVIVNRVELGTWGGDSISEVILERGQFSSLFNWYEKSMTPDQDTKDAVELVLNGTIDREEFSQGADSFYDYIMVGYMDYFESMTFICQMNEDRFFKS